MKNKKGYAKGGRVKMMGGGNMKKKGYAKGGAARKTMSGGGKVIKGPYS